MKSKSDLGKKSSFLNFYAVKSMSQNFAAVFLFVGTAVATESSICNKTCNVTLLTLLQQHKVQLLVKSMSRDWQPFSTLRCCCCCWPTCSSTGTASNRLANSWSTTGACSTSRYSTSHSLPTEYQIKDVYKEKIVR
jgi:hypothetical protein